MISLKQLVHLTAIAEQGNMHKAADALGLTQPALTRSLNTLENLLDVRLFDRHSGGMQATPFCLEIIEKCQQVVIDVEDIQRAARLHQNIEAGELNIGVGGGVRELVLRASVPEFVSRHPNIRIKVSEGKHEDLIGELKTRNLDFLLIGLSSFEQSSEIRKETITTLPLSVMARSGHPLQSQKKLSIDQLIRFPLVSPAQVGASHTLTAAITRAASEPIRPRVICSDFPTLISVLMCSDALLFSAPCNCEDELRQGALIELDFSHSDLKTELGIIEMSKRSRSPAAQEFIDILAEGIAK